MCLEVKYLSANCLSVKIICMAIVVKYDKLDINVCKLLYINMSTLISKEFEFGV